MIRTRFAPSPTGDLHIGGVRTALFAWAFAKKHGGTFILRIEDTDIERSEDRFVRPIFKAMDWLGLDYQEGPHFQSKRTERYRQAIQQLLASGDAYHCYATREELDQLRERQIAAGIKPRYDRRWRDSALTPPTGIQPVVRFKNPLAGKVSFTDLIKGDVTFDNSELDDLIIARSDGSPTYNLCVVVDDIDMQITHVIRGDDHVNNTPRQINICRALGYTPPKFAHIPMLMGADGAKLSKRHGATGVMSFLEQGYLPETLLNYLARLGWGAGDHEIFSLEKFVDLFDLNDVGQSPSRFDPNKLLWLNQYYIRQSNASRLVDLLSNMSSNTDDGASSITPDLIDLLKYRCNTLVDLHRQCDQLGVDPTHTHSSGQISNAALTVSPLRQLSSEMTSIEWHRESVSGLISSVATAHRLKFSDLAMPLRLALTGKTQSPPVDAVMTVLGREKTLSRLRNYLA